MKREYSPLLKSKVIKKIETNDVVTMGVIPPIPKDKSALWVKRMMPILVL